MPVGDGGDLCRDKEPLNWLGGHRLATRGDTVETHTSALLVGVFKVSAES